MSGNWTSWIPVLSFIGDENVAPWSVERAKYAVPPPLFPVKRDQEKYTLPSHEPPVRSASIDVLSLNFPSRFGADDPFATIVDPRNRLPSSVVGWPLAFGLSNRATQTSPKVFFEPDGSSEDSEPMKSRPWLSHAMTGSPAEAVRIFASAAYGEVSPG